ncbi:hypothetical protein HGB24_03830 [Candidatus Saccharibacteria bacterium]|nr:hypothetical protein [Candidatus Saccharibacteria bacterium]
MIKNTHLLVIGFDEIVSNKYINSIKKAVESGNINGYSILDLSSQRQNIESRLASLDLQPDNIYLIDDPTKDKPCKADDFEPIIRKIRSENDSIKVYIATELRAHEVYLRYCVENGIDSLVEKPVLAPMVCGRFVPENINPIIRDLVEKSKQKDARHSVMTLGRYHPIYNDKLIGSLKKVMINEKSPLTSLHLRAAGGVWNLHREYESREDHPYKYGYGMIMHGAYHYIDLVTQMLLLNKLIYPDVIFEVKLSSFGAYPHDQNDRISKKYSDMFDDNEPDRHSLDSNEAKYGETDITCSFCMSDKKTGRKITVGTISLEQTTPSIRSWKDIPDGLYNKNGRTSSVQYEAQLSTLMSVGVHCYDVPIAENHQVDRIDAKAVLITRKNASLLKDAKYIEEKNYTGIFHSESNKRLMEAWLSNQEDRSSLESHLPVMLLAQALAESLKNQGKAVIFDLG